MVKIVQRPQAKSEGKEQQGGLRYDVIVIYEPMSKYPGESCAKIRPYVRKHTNVFFVKTIEKVVCAKETYETDREDKYHERLMVKG